MLRPSLLLPGLVLAVLGLPTGSAASPPPVSTTTGSGSLAALEVPSVFSDHAVLQRGRPVPVWGRGTPGEPVTVTFAEFEVHGTVAEDGSWRVDLPALTASTVGRTLTIGSGDEIIAIEDVLVGEVWICSGQSNMEWPVSAAEDAEQVIPNGHHPLLRCIEPPHRLSRTPVFSTGARWQVATPETIGGFSAVGTAFALELIAALDVPVGILGIHWGGTRAEPWTDRRFLAKHPRFTDTVARFEEELAAWVDRDAAAIAEDHRVAVLKYEERMRGWWESQLGRDADALLAAGRDAGWTARGFDDAGWGTMPVPGLWRDHSALGDFDGLGRYRRLVEIPDAWAGRALELRLGPVDDADRVWFDGVLVGQTTHSWNTPRTYRIPAERVTAGKHAIALAVLDTGGAGGTTGSSGDYSLRPLGPGAVDTGAAPAIDLSGPWLFDAGVEFDGNRGAARPSLPVSPAERNTGPGLIHDAMLRPFIPYAIRGATWYQGESNAGEPEAYRDLLPLMITNWRAAWGQGNFPFGIVQLAAFRAPSDDPNQGGWAFLRDAQRHAHHVSVETGLVVTIDIGDANDIHPRNKREVGRRLALWALARVHERWLEHSGPVFSGVVRPVEGVTPEGSAAQVFLLHAKGLATRDGGAATGFGVSSDGETWHWVTGAIAGQSITLRHPDGVPIRHIRYAWSDNPVRANVVNADGLPMEPFRWESSD